MYHEIKVFENMGSLKCEAMEKFYMDLGITNNVAQDVKLKQVEEDVLVQRR